MKKQRVVDTFFSNLSDEELYMRMSEGDKFAQDVLFRRFEHMGRQMAGVIIRTHQLTRYTSDDFLESIQDAIHTSIRYYKLGKTSFYVYCHERLAQFLARRTQEIELENKIANESVPLDSTIRDDKTLSYHDVVSNSYQLSSPSRLDANSLRESIDQIGSYKTRRVVKIYLLHSAGYSIREISKMLTVSEYSVRQALGSIHLYADEIRDVLNIK